VAGGSVGCVRGANAPEKNQAWERHWIAHQPNEDGERDVYWNEPGKAVVPKARAKRKVEE